MWLLLYWAVIVSVQRGYIVVVSGDKVDEEVVRARQISHFFHGTTNVMKNSSSSRKDPERLRRTDEAPTFRRRDLKLPGKKGICYTLRDEGQEGSWVENLPLVKYLKPSWNYSWGSKRIDQQPDDIEFIPMIWGAWGYDGLKSKIDNDILPQVQTGKCKRLLGFNEPDSTKQANLAYTKALDFWPVLESAGVPLASPVPVQQDSDWMKGFVQGAKAANLRIDYLAVHWYEGVVPDSFKRKMKAVYVNSGKQAPLLITEFAPADWTATSTANNKYSRAQVLAFMKEVLPWMEKTRWIAGYAWFPFRADSPQGSCSSLFEIDGTPTALGRFYASVTNDNPIGDQSIQI